MMTSSNGNIFRVTGPLCREFTGRRWSPCTKASDAELWCFFDLRPNKRLSKQSWGWWFETPSRPLWRHCNGWVDQYLIKLHACRCCRQCILCVGSISYLYILSSNFRRCVACKVSSQILKFEFFAIFLIFEFDFVFFSLGIWCESLVWVIMERRGVSQNAGVLVVLVISVTLMHAFFKTTVLVGDAVCDSNKPLCL